MAEPRQGEVKSARVHSNLQPRRVGEGLEGQGTGRKGNLPQEVDAAPRAVAGLGGHSSHALQGPAAWISGSHVQHRCRMGRCSKVGTGRGGD